MEELVLSVSDFVAVCNQTLEYAYPSIVIVGELSNFKVSKNKWVYFDLKDEYSSVRFFGTVYTLPGPLEDGMMVQVRGVPRLHNQFGFSVNVQTIQPVGEGSIKKAAALLEKKLAAEGLFDESRKRTLPAIPRRIGLITSGESAAYHDFIKILNARWGGVTVLLADVQVQGEAAPGQIVKAIEHFASKEDVEILVITRGGGSADDLAAFSTESVTRAVAASRIPTLVAVGHEVDVSLAELAADQRASTPSNAAEMVVPDKRHELRLVRNTLTVLDDTLGKFVGDRQQQLGETTMLLHQLIAGKLQSARDMLRMQDSLLIALSPEAALARGYAILRNEQGSVIKSSREVAMGDDLLIQLGDGVVRARAERKR